MSRWALIAEVGGRFHTWPPDFLPESKKINSKKIIKVMKRRVKKNYVSAVLIVCAALTMSCSSNGADQKNARQKSYEGGMAMEGPVFANAKIKAVYSHYLGVKDALIEKNVAAARKNARLLESSLVAAGDTKAAGIAARIAASSSIAGQRGELTPLTAAVEKLVKASKIVSGVVYLQHCPMANDGEGGNWLSSEKNIRNPYYGTDMISCGTIEEEIK